MDDLDTLVLRAATGWRIAGLSVVLVTVARTWGSSPRPPGSLMAINSRGETIGSVSGGCIEDDLILRIQDEGRPSAQTACPPYFAMVFQPTRHVTLACLVAGPWNWYFRNKHR